MYELMFMHEWTFYHLIAHSLRRATFRFPNYMNRNKIKVKEKAKETQVLLIENYILITK